MPRLHLNKTVESRNLYPLVSGTMRPDNMPGYRAPHICTNLPTDNAAEPVTVEAADSMDPIIVSLLTYSIE